MFKELIQSLRPYATEAPQSAPPEILPWDSDDPWSVENAARATLALLLDDEGPGEQLYALAEYLLVFINPGYGRWLRDNDIQLLNGTALALCGYLCHDQHPEAEIWRLTGCARLASAAHNRRAALDDVPLTDCVRVVTQVARSLNQPIVADLLTIEERMFGVLVDHDRAEFIRVSEEAYPSYMVNPVPVEKVGETLRDRPWMAEAVAMEYLAEPDMTAADLLLENIFTMTAHMLVRHRFDGEIDWNLHFFEDKESTVSMNHHGFLTDLAGAYFGTMEKKFVNKGEELVWSWYKMSPAPNHWLPLGPWRTLEVGNRQANMWPALLAALYQTRSHGEPVTHAMMGRSRLEHIRYLLAFTGGANNWYQVESAGLAVAALFSPEVRHADAYLRVAMRRLKWINSFAYYDDGFQFELTHGYHVFPTRSMFSVVKAAQARGVTLPQDFTGLMERAHEMYLFAMQPDHLLPAFNDSNPNPIDPATMLYAAAEAFDRDDFRWAGTQGTEDSPPAHASHAWNDAGLYAMRSDWSRTAQFLHFDGAPWGASHQHEDKLNFIIHAGGRLLIGDPNIYSYAPTELTHYFISSRAHNLVMIDGMGQARRALPELKLQNTGRNEWASHPRFDFVSSEYLDGYAPHPYLPGRRGSAAEITRDEIDTRFAQRRAIFYIKPDGDLPGYWLLSDLITGPADGHHTLEQIFHIAPIYTPGAQPPIAAGNVEVRPQRIITQDDGLSNITILPVDTDRLNVRKEKGQVNPARGWYGMLGEFPAWDVTLEVEKALPARLDAVLFPLEPGASTAPTVERLLSDANTTAFRVTGDGFDDTLILNEDPNQAVTVGDVTLTGRVIVVRRLPEIRAYGMYGSTCSVGGNTITVEA